MRKSLCIALLGILAASCQLADTAAELFRGEVVARAGDHKLHRSQLEDYIPQGVSAQDSAQLPRQYIEAWAKDLLMLDMANEQLSAQEKDVSQELEEYRRTLLKYRYEQLYISQRLDTLVSAEEIARFFRENPHMFTLERPVVKARSLVIPADSKNYRALRLMICSTEQEQVMEAASLAATSAIRFLDLADNWTDVLALSRELGAEHHRLFSNVRSGYNEYTDADGIAYITYVRELIPEGKTAPEEFVTQRVRDLILSERRHKLETQLERSLLENARAKDKFVIY